MERRKFIRTCGYALVGLPVAFGVLQSCGGFYYAKINETPEEIKVSKSEFTLNPEKPGKKRDFVLIDSAYYNFPICLYRVNESDYVASLLKCTHQGCELNVGGGIYSCPCHGSEFSKEGTVLKGPADQKLKTFATKNNPEHVIIYLS